MLEDINTWMVYRHISPSGKVYVGISKNSTIRRWGRNGNGYKKEPIFWNAIQKYGWNNIKHEVILINLNKSNANYAESYLIRWYKLKGISYNVTDGGEGTVGWHPSKELREQWSRKRKGRIIDKEWRKRLSQATKGRKMPREIYEKGIAAVKKKYSKPVIQLDLQGNYISSFSCIKDAARHLGNEKKDSDISKCCRNKGVLTVCGYLWMFKNDYDRFIKNDTLKEELDNRLYKVQHKYKYIRTKEFREKLSQASKGKQFCSDEHMEILKKIGPEASKKCILQMNLNNEPIAVFHSAVEIYKKLGFNRSCISVCCNGKSQTSHGYKWKFITKDEYRQFKEMLIA